MKKLMAALILTLAGAPVFAAQTGLARVGEGLAPQLEAAGAPSAAPETLGLSGENISMVLQGGEAAATAPAVEIAAAAPAVSAIAALEPALPPAASAPAAIERLAAAPSRSKPRSRLADAIIVLAFLAASAAGYVAMFHAFGEALQNGFDGPPQIEQPYQLVR